MTDTPEAVATCSWCGGKARTHGLGCPQATRPDADIVRQLVEACEHAAKNAEPKRGEVSLHASDWMALMDALRAARAAGYGGQS